MRLIQSANASTASVILSVLFGDKLYLATGLTLLKEIS